MTNANAKFRITDKMDKAGIDKAVKSIGNRANILQADIQLTGLSILRHIEAHKDTTIADSLIAAMPRGQKAKALVKWFTEFGSMRPLNRDVKSEAEKIKAGRFMQYEAKKETNIPDAEKTQWFETIKQDDVLEIWDAYQAMQNLVKRIQSAQNKKLDIKNKTLAIKELANIQKMLSA